MSKSKSFEYYEAAYKPQPAKEEHRPPPRNGFGFFEAASRDAKNASEIDSKSKLAKIKQYEINEQWIRFWRAEGPRPPEGTMYIDMPADQTDEQ